MKPSRLLSAHGLRPHALTRRAFLKRVALTSGALATAGGFVSPIAVARQETSTSGSTGVAATSSVRATPAAVIAFFDGQLWLDTSGTSDPYQPPRGARGAAPLAKLTDQELRGIQGWL